MIDEARGDVDDVSAALLRHVTDDALREVEEATRVHGRHRCEVVGVLQERFANEDPRVVDQRVDAAEAVERLLDDALSGLGLRDVALDCVHVSCVRRGYRKRGRDDEVANPTDSTCDPGSGPCDAPVTFATFRGSGGDVIRRGTSRRSRLPAGGRRR